MKKAALQELVEASVGSLRDCSEQFAALKDRHEALLARVAGLEAVLERVHELLADPEGADVLEALSVIEALDG